MISPAFHKCNEIELPAKPKLHMKQMLDMSLV